MTESKGLLKVSYKELNVVNFQIVKEADKKITYNLLYNNNPWTLKIPSSTVKNNLIKSGDLYILDLNCSDNVVKTFNTIDNYVIEYITKNSVQLLGKEHDQAKIEDIYKETVRYLKGSSYLRLRIDDKLKIYDKVGQNIDAKEMQNLIKKDDKIGLLLRLDNVRIGGGGIIKCNWYVDQVKLSRVITECEISDSESESDTNYDEDTEY